MGHPPVLRAQGGGGDGPAGRQDDRPNQNPGPGLWPGCDWYEGPESGSFFRLRASHLRRREGVGEGGGSELGASPWALSDPEETVAFTETQNLYLLSGSLPIVGSKHLQSLRKPTPNSNRTAAEHLKGKDSRNQCKGHERSGLSRQRW